MKGLSVWILCLGLILAVLATACIIYTITLPYKKSQDRSPFDLILPQKHTQDRSPFDLILPQQNSQDKSPFDLILYINLEHRTDRRKQVEQELHNLGWLGASIRLNAVNTPNYGAFGCLLSHIQCLWTFLDSPGNIQNVLILEDDIQFIRNPTADVEEFFNSHKSAWDVLMLSSDTRYELPHLPNATKIIDAQTTSAYAVNRPFAHKLLKLWESSISLFNDMNANKNARECDVTWKKLQPESNWYCLFPKPALQRPSFSDIEHKNVHYNW